MLNNNRITGQIENYIIYKRSLGYKITTESYLLRNFALYTRTVDYTGPLSSEVIISWVCRNPQYSRWYKSRRLETVHTFAVYISAFDQDARIPQNGIFGKCHGRVSPHIYTEQELSKLMKAAEHLFSPDGIRIITVKTSLGLLWSTGLRVSELTSLKISDVDPDKGLIFVRQSKFKKSRIIPLHPSVIKKLTDYSQLIAKHIEQRKNEDYYFVSSGNRRFNTGAFEYAFHLISPCLYNDKNCKLPHRKPRLYDFRHTFACRTVKNWLDSGEDVNGKLFLLSTYMGHVKPEETFWYLSATPELLSVSCRKYEKLFGTEGGVYE